MLSKLQWYASRYARGLRTLEYFLMMGVGFIGGSLCDECIVESEEWVEWDAVDSDEFIWLKEEDELLLGSCNNGGEDG